VVDAYLQAGHDVLVVDDLSTGRRAHLNPAARLVEMDVRDPALVELARRERIEILNHHAAQASVPVSVRQPRLDAEVNVIGTINCLQAAQAAAARKFIYVSSGGAMYGEPRYLPMDEQHPVVPMSPYAASKGRAEDWVRVLCEAAGMEYTCLRYGNVYGPRQDPYGEGGVVAIFAHKLLKGEPPEIHWDGEQQRDFVYVGDVGRVNLLVLEGGPGQAYNVGTGRGTTVNQLYRMLAAATGVQLEPRHAPRRPGDIRASYLSTAKIRAHLGWEPQVGLEEGIRLAVDAMCRALAADARP
jgi:UDP-glucose 4-epimerase